MKMLLTSAGFTNKTIVQALKDLVDKPFSELKLAFIPTAANVELGGKEWLIEDMYRCTQLGLKQVDIVDIAALPREEIIKRLQEADLIFVGGGNTYYLMTCIEKLNLKEFLLELLKTRVYIGLSAGSMIVSKWWSCDYDAQYYNEPEGPKRYNCLGITDLHIMPHLYPSEFPKVTLKKIEILAKDFDDPLYALDDNSALKYVDGNIEVVSEGTWGKFN